MNEGRNGCPSLYSASPFIEEEMTISDALVATVHILLHNFSHGYSSCHYFAEIKTDYLNAAAASFQSDMTSHPRDSACLHLQ